MTERCTPNQIQTLPEFMAMVDQLTLDWIANIGEEFVDRQYEFSTTEADLAGKLKYLSAASRRLDDESAFWELFHCASCETFAGEFAFHVRLSA